MKNDLVLLIFVYNCVFQYLSQHLAINNSKIPWINWFLTFSFPRKTFIWVELLANLVIKWWYLQCELYLVVWNLHSSSQKRWWGFKTPAPTFKPAFLQTWRSTQMHWLFRGRGKRSHQLFSQTRSVKFPYIVGSKEDYAY